MPSKGADPVQATLAKTTYFGPATLTGVLSLDDIVAVACREKANRSYVT